ncbi:ABC transporter permease [Streptomyces indicus]|uniref:Putative ABC transport system permease protein n=1 Tax=Streptomyces indicus TaxID=417292 RepID=A0A1G9HE50_9ACTN|nr:ABC transporter permease [Streptomyces indicus]SDL10974.1 putative ABC transport system permease protein [Streptomyces indicus]
MFALALRSVRQRPGRFAATLFSAFLGALIIMTFNSMHDTAAGAGVDDRSAETLTVAASVVGGYGSLLVFFAVASTLTVAVRQRADEIELLRTTGATPAQIKRMVVGEAFAVALLGAALAVIPAMFGGRALLDLFQDSGQVAGSVEHSFGPIALSTGFDITLLASVCAAFLAVRRAGRRTVRKQGRARTFFSYAALGAGALSLASTSAFDGDAEMLMAPAAYGAILLSVCCALLSTRILPVALTVLEGPVTALAGAGGYLTVRNMRQRAAQLSNVLMPLILFTGMAVATLYMQGVENDAVRASGLVKAADAKTLETLNYAVVGIIVAFCCIMLINTLYATTSYRVREFGQQRLAGATPRQVLAMVAAESTVLTVTGVALGSLTGFAGIVAFTSVRTDGLLPGQGLGIWLAVTGIAAAVTIGTSVGTAWRQLRAPAVEAVALAA